MRDKSGRFVKGILRPIVKSWMTIALTNGKLPSIWPSKAKRELEKKLPGVKIPAATKVTEAVLKRYKWLARTLDRQVRPSLSPLLPCIRFAGSTD